MKGLAFLGRNEFQNAKTEFLLGLEEDAMHFGCKMHLVLASEMESGELIPESVSIRKII
jgi:hypothetical protein